MAKDMTQGSAYKHILSFSVPLLAGSVFQQFYNVVDTVVVGRYVNSNALAAIGTATPAMMLCLSLFAGLGMGITIVVSQYFGAKDNANLKRALSTSIYMMMVITVIMTALGIFITKPLLNLMRVPPEIMGDASTYLYTIFGGVVFMIVYNTYAAVLRGVGDSITPTVFLIIAALLNVVLDLLFVLQFHMGVFGVAIATVIAQGVSGVLCYFYVKIKVPMLTIEKEYRAFDPGMFRVMLRMGIPSAIQMSFISVSQIAVQSLVNSYGSIVMAGYTSATKIDNFAFQPGMNIGNALGVFVGQNIGAGKMDRVDEGFKATFYLELIVSGLVSAIAFFFAPQLISLFNTGSDSAEIIAVGSEYLRVVGAFYLVLGAMYVYQNLFRGAGDMNMVLVLTVINFALRVAGAYAMAAIPWIGRGAIWWAIPLGWLVSDIAGHIMYKTGRWRRFALAKAENGGAPDLLME